MPQDAQNLIWIDLEMTGLDTDNDQIIEIATLVTDKDLQVIDEGPVMAIHQGEEVLNAMDEWNTRQHGKSGLIERVRKSDITYAEAEQATLAFLKQYVAESTSPMCGNSICQDRRFLHRCMPALEKWFHYRNLDVSSLKELMDRWKPQTPGFVKQSSHRALEDIKDSIDELRFYRDNFLQL